MDSVIAAIATYYLNTESRAKANSDTDQNKSHDMDVNLMTTENVDKDVIDSMVARGKCMQGKTCNLCKNTD